MGGADFGYCPFMAAILAALTLSPVSLYHYRAEVWWGRPVDVCVTLIRRDGDWAAKMTAATEVQWAFVHRSRVVSDCQLVPAAVVRQLVGSCRRVPPDWSIVVGGPTERRRVHKPFPHCAAPVVYASRLDPSWTQVQNCAASGGTFFLHRGRIVKWEIDGPGCVWAPPGVIRSLHGRCLPAP
jgi:hypothetical protein